MELDDTAEFLNDLQPKRNRKRVSEQLPPIKLVCWRFNFKRLVEKSGGLFHDVALCIEGVRADNGTHWSTSEIHELIDSRHVKTKSSVYELVGKMERPLSLDRGFPHELIDKFANGFPDDWYEELRKFIDFGRRELQNHQNSQQPVVQFEASDSNESTRKRSQDFDDSPPLEKRRLSQRFQDDDDQSFDFAWPPDFDLPERLSEVDDEPQTSGIEPVNKDSLQVDSREHTPTPDPFETPRRLTRSATRLQNSQKTLTPVTPPNRPKRGRKFKRDSDFFTPQTPELNRSKRGRLLKPRLAFGERIVYNSKGEAIEARTSTTTTHLTNKNSKALKAIANGLHLQKADTPKQTERRLQSVYQPKKPKRRESQSKSALRKLLEYKSDSDHEEATPLAARKPQLGRRVVESDDDEESDSIASRTRQRTKRQPKNVKRRASDTKTLKRNVRQSAGKPRRSSFPAIRSQTHQTTKTSRTSTRRSETSKTQPSTIATPKPKRKRWGEKEKADLKTGFNLFNPIEEEDWNRLVEILPIDWTLEEVKAQAKVMRLKPVILNNQKHIRKSTDLLDRIKRLMVSGKMPAKGTLKREELEDAVQELVSKQNFVDTANDQLQDSLDDDEFLDEALRNYGLDDSIRVGNDRMFTPARRMFIPKPVFMSRRRSSMMAAQTVGDEFVLPNRDKEQRFRRQYRANQYNKRHGRNQQREDDENESKATADETNDTMESSGVNDQSPITPIRCTSAASTVLDVSVMGISF
ncbi:hypothetical protein M3Y94_01020700 [Aphelenchoides besseyi]|nr:hypothetical protein M3Y94_01020700 [Aphelenchoides besseyi]KAI6216853.1 hypothetical protein M3Y95_01253200 [Aphelenchoides besseyi]